jgi:hypothetical protein
MECQFAFVCDHAEQDHKLHALGIGWDTIYAQSLPCLHSTMGFVAGLRGSLAEAGTKTVMLRLIDADGEDVIPPMENQVAFDLRPPLLEGNLRIVLNLVNVQFKKYGPYAIHLVLQGNEMASVTFNISEMPTTA